MSKSRFLPLLKKESLEIIRTYKFLILAAVFLFFGLASPLAARFMPQFLESMNKQMNIVIQIPTPTYKDAVLQFTKNISQMISFVLFFLCMGLVATEKSSGTAVFVLVKPVSRAKFVLAKLVVLWLAVLICHVAAALFCYFYTLVLFGELPLLPFLITNGILILYLLWLVTLIAFFSMIMNSSAAAAGLSILTWAVLIFISTWGEPGKFSPMALISLSEAPFTGKALYWQPFVILGISLAALVAGGITLFRKWEP